VEHLLAPAWIVALATAGYLGAMAVVKIKGNGKAPLGYETAQTSALQAVTLTLTALTERIAHLPTREDLGAVAQQNRHDYRNALQVVSGVIEDRIDRAEQNLEKAITRRSDSR
jgi:hypothetical protein